MMWNHRRQKSFIFWVILLTGSGSFAGAVVGLMSLLLLLMLCLTVVFGTDTKISQQQLPTNAAAAQAPFTSHTWTGLANVPVVAEALHIASAISNGPPDNLGTWYDAASIPDAVAYWQRTCSGCTAWQEGNLQCVMLLTAAYGLAGQPLPYVGNAITFFTSGAYLHQPGWEEVSPESMPYPGDIIVLNSPYFGGVGHVVIVVDVQPPSRHGPGTVTFAQANGPGSINREPLTQDAAGSLHMQIWPNYTVMGYVRHVTSLTRPSLT